MADAPVGEGTGRSGVLGDHIAVAGFHPDWVFGGEEPACPVHWEKRSPHPTVSIIHAEAIAHAEAATESISETNERILEELGFDSLEARFKSQVILPGASGPADGWD